MGKQYFSLTEVSVACDRAPRTLSGMLYNGTIDGSNWPVIGGRRLVPAAELPRLKRLLKRGRRAASVK
jgi:hypothetical protein